MRALSILTPQEMYILSLMATTADLMRRYDPYNASTLDSMTLNQLLLKISEGDASRKGLKEILNPVQGVPVLPVDTSATNAAGTGTAAATAEVELAAQTV